MDIFLRVFLYIFCFVLGAVLVQRKAIKRAHASDMLWWLFYAGLPITVFYAITSTTITYDQLILPIAGAMISTFSGIVSIALGIWLKIPRKVLGVLVASAMIMNTNMSLPFFAAFHGAEGLAIFSIFDLGNLIMIFTVTYFVTLKIGGVPLTGLTLLERVMKMPAMWVIIGSLVLVFNGFQLPKDIQFVFSWVTFGIFLTVMFTLGMLFEPKFTHLKFILIGLILRYVLGFALGYIVVRTLNLQGIERLVVLIGSASPNGYTSLVYAKIAKLDTHFAGQLVSLSMGVGIILIPLMLLFVQ